MLSLSLSLLALVISSVYAAPAQPVRRTVSALSASTLSAFTPFGQFSRASYCSADSIRTWTCGEACKALPDFQPTLVGGDGNGIQVYFVGYWPAQNSVIVSHEGTDPTKLVSVLTDLNILTDPLDPKLFPGVPSTVWVHDGFRNEQALTAPAILAEVKRLFALKGSTTVITVGHSLGGALAELDAVFLSLNLPPTTSVKTYTFGKPRVGNAAWAALVDQKTSLTRINNMKDIVPIVPGRGLGFAHPKGEVHLLAPGTAVACSGEDDATDSQCQIATVPNIFFGNVLNHLGPYEGINMGTIFCV